MSEGVLVAIIGGGFTIITVILAWLLRVAVQTHKAVNSRLDASLALNKNMEQTIRDLQQIIERDAVARSSSQQRTD